MTKVRVGNSSTRVKLVESTKYSSFLSPRGPAPDPWLEPIQTIDASGDVVIDYSLGKHCVLNVIGDIDTISVTNWPVPGRIARLTLEFINTGPYGVTSWDSSIMWPGGAVPDITQGPNRRDRVILSTTDGGAVVYGDSIGFDYRTI